jgi:broad specificity phosphatase PhoE
MGRILLLRHGQASLLEDDYDRLSPLGRAQGEVVGRWLAARQAPPQAVVSGTLRRQVDTAAACIAAAGWDSVPTSIDESFDEYSHHDLFAQAFPDLADPSVLGAHLRASAQPRHEFQRLFAQALSGWLRGETQGRAGLTWAAFRERRMAAVQRVAAACESGRYVIVVTSGGPIAAICQAALDVPDERVPALFTPLFNASITQLLTRGTDIGLSIFNSVAHLEADAALEGLVTYR